MLYVKQTQGLETRKLKTMHTLIIRQLFVLTAARLVLIIGILYWQLLDKRIFDFFAQSCPAAKLCQLNSFKLLILPTQKVCFARWTTNSRLQVAVMYLSEINDTFINKIQKNFHFSPLKNL